jgi:MgsA AAA+ ATPase C terminal
MRVRLASSVDRQAGRAPCRAAKVQAAAMERYASQPDAAMYYLARMVEADEDPKFIARRMAIFVSELKVPSGRGHAAPASLVNLKKLEDGVSMNKRMNRASTPPEAAILVEVGSHRPHKVVFDAFGPFKILWVITNGTMRRNFLWITLRKTGIYVASGDTLVRFRPTKGSLAHGPYEWEGRR